MGALVAAASGNNAVCQVLPEAQQLYPGVDRADLSEEQRQTISTLSTLAAGLAGGMYHPNYSRSQTRHKALSFQKVG